MDISIYLAGPWAQRAEVRAVRDQLMSTGIQVNARWLDVPDLEESDIAGMANEAVRDLEDIKKSAAMVVVNLQKSEGKAVEQGIALEMGMPLIVIGKRSNVFQYLPQVIVVDTLFAAIGELNKIAQRGRYGVGRPRLAA